MDTTHHRAHENLAFSHTSMANIANNSLVHDMMTEKKKQQKWNIKFGETGKNGKLF